MPNLTYSIHNYPSGLRKRQKKFRQRPALPRERSTIGARRLDFRVRDGNGYDPSAIVTGKIYICITSHLENISICGVIGKKKVRQLPTLPRERSTIGVRGLDFRVRDGNGYNTSAMATGPDSL